MKTTKWDAAEFLESEEMIAAYIEEAFAEGDQKMIQKALGNVARARGISGLAKETGLSRETIYKALSEDGDPRFSTLMSLMKAMGLKLVAEPKAA